MFDFQKTFIFKSLPAYFANQRLCPGQPSAPLNFALYNDYVDALQLFNEQHTQCFNCHPDTPPRFAIVDSVLLEPEQDTIQSLPYFIGLQFLFEDEPVGVPPNVEEFYHCYVENGAYADCPNQLQVQTYHQHLLQVAYPAALEKWKAGLSAGKLARYQTYCSKRDILSEDFPILYERLSIKTTTATVANANADNPMTP